MKVHLASVIRTGLAALVLGFLALTAPAIAQQPTSINPTAQSVKEAQLLEALKPGTVISGRISIPDSRASNLMQPGRDWRSFNQGTLHQIGTYSVLGTLALLVLFFLVRGRIKIDAGPSLDRIMRFSSLDRFAHWLSAVSFIVLAITGANVTFGKSVLAPAIGPEAFAAWAAYAKLIHNYIGFAFMVGVVLIFLVWVKDNIPNGQDLKWFAVGGGLLTKGSHPPAKRFNGGQKIIFWSVVVGGFFLSLTGWHLIFPTEHGVADLQWHATIHGTVAFVMIALMLAHAYIGSIGMEGAFDAMGSGEVDLNWAKEHHSLWVKEEMERKGPSRITSGAVQPAE